MRAGSLSLSEASRLAILSDKSLKTTELEKEKIGLQASALDGSFDWKLENSTRYIDDQSKSLLDPFDKNKTFANNFSLSSLFSTGAKLRAETVLSHSDGTLSKTYPNASGLPSESYETRVELSLSQPLLRNFMAREISLQKEAILNQSETFSFTEQLKKQQIMFNMEIYFLNFSFHTKQEKILEKLANQAKIFADLTKKRVNMGRSDPIDIAAADARVLQYDGRILDSQNAIIENRLKIILNAYPGKDVQETSLALLNLEEPFPMLFRKPEDAFLIGEKKRLDILQIEANKKPITAQIDLCEERDKINLDGFVSFSTNAIDNNLSDSLSQMSQFDHPQVMVGVILSKILGDSFNKANKASYLKELEIFTYQKTSILEQLKTDLHLAFSQLDSLHRKELLTKKNLQILNSQLQAAQKSKEELRGDELAAIRYGLEILEAKLQLLQAQYQKRQMEAKLKFMTHSYSL